MRSSVSASISGRGCGIHRDEVLQFALAQAGNTVASIAEGHERRCRSLSAEAMAIRAELVARSTGFATKRHAVVVYAGKEAAKHDQFMWGTTPQFVKNHKECDFRRIQDTDTGKWLMQQQVFCDIEAPKGVQRHESWRSIERWEAKVLWDEASRLYIGQAKGHLVAVVLDSTPDSTYQRIELPFALANPEITTINRIDVNELRLLAIQGERALAIDAIARRTQEQVRPALDRAQAEARVARLERELEDRRCSEYRRDTYDRQRGMDLNR